MVNCKNEKQHMNSQMSSDSLPNFFLLPSKFLLVFKLLIKQVVSSGQESVQPHERTEFRSNWKWTMFKTKVVLVCDQTWKWIYVRKLRDIFLIQHSLERHLAAGRVCVVSYKPENWLLVSTIVNGFFPLFIFNRKPTPSTLKAGDLRSNVSRCQVCMRKT